MPCTVTILRNSNIGGPPQTVIGPISVKAAETIAIENACNEGVVMIKIRKTR